MRAHLTKRLQWRLGRPPRVVGFVLRMIGVCRSRQQHAKYIESKIIEIVFQFPWQVALYQNVRAGGLSADYTFLTFGTTIDWRRDSNFVI